LGCAGRAAALNAGAKAAKGQVLLFLHADSTLPRYWDLEVGSNTWLANKRILPGYFSHRDRGRNIDIDIDFHRDRHGE